MEKWSPILITPDEQYQKLVIGSWKKQIRNILKSYVGMYDPFCELLQNAMDAIEKRTQVFDNSMRKIFIDIDMRENSIYVADSGIGFCENEFKTFLSPNISYKTIGQTRGNKGVGATYLAFGFHKLEAYTKTADYNSFIMLSGGRNWVFEENDELQMPQVVRTDIVDEAFPFDRGSSFKLYLSSDDKQQVTDLSWRGLNNAEAWSYALLTNTPLGHLDLTRQENIPITYSIRVTNTKGEITEQKDCQARYFFPHEFFSTSSQNLEDVFDWQKKQIDIGRDPAAIPQKFAKKRIIYEFFTNDELVDLAERSKTLTEEEMELLKLYSLIAYGAFANSARRWDDINERMIKARRGVKIVTAGLQLATSHMIQGSMLQIPLTSNIGYQKQTCIMIHFDNAEPDLGRKGFQPELRTLAEKISSMIVTLRLKRWKKLLVADDAGDNPDLKSKTNYDYIKEMEEYEKKHKLEIRNKNFFLPSKEISITAEPKSEQDVVVLFSQLIAGGVIRSIELLATSSINQYDGLYRVNIKPPEEMHYFDAEINPLGVVKDVPIQFGQNTHPLFLEYKTNFDSIIQDFENQDKNPSDIGLIVVWTMGTRWQDEYQVISTLLPEYSDRRRYHGFTHEIYYEPLSKSKIDCIVLEELIAFLNDPNEYRQRFGRCYQEE